MTTATSEARCRFLKQCTDEGEKCLKCAENQGMKSHFREIGIPETKDEGTSVFYRCHISRPHPWDADLPLRPWQPYEVWNLT